MIDHDVGREVVQRGLGRGGQFAELFVEQRSSFVLVMENEEVRSLRLSADAGAGIRVVRGGSVGFVYTEDLSDRSLHEAAIEAGSAIGGGRRQDAVEPALGGTATVDERDWHPASFQVTKRLELLSRVQRAARQASPHIASVTVEMLERNQQVLVINSEGLAVTDRRRCLFALIKVTAHRGGRTATVRTRLGLPNPTDLQLELADEAGEQAARLAETWLDAVPAPAGSMPVILGPGAGGMLVHEAIGHPFEGDYVARGESPYGAKLGERVAPTHVTVWDDPTLPGMLGSYDHDDEATRARPVCLIEKGRATGFLCDRLSADRLGLPATGHGRRDGYRKLPAPRISNIYLAGGDHSYEEILRNTPRGLYAAALSGGQSDVGTGDFTFRVTEGYLIENGRITAPVEEVTLVGNSMAVLTGIEMVGGEMTFHPGQCEKLGQNLEIASGSPAFRVKELVVGGSRLRRDAGHG